MKSLFTALALTLSAQADQWSDAFTFEKIALPETINVSSPLSTAVK